MFSKVGENWGEATGKTNTVWTKNKNKIKIHKAKTFIVKVTFPIFSTRKWFFPTQEFDRSPVSWAFSVKTSLWCGKRAKITTDFIYVCAARSSSLVQDDKRGWSRPVVLRSFQPAAPEREARAGQRVDPAGRCAPSHPVCGLGLRLDSRINTTICLVFRLNSLLPLGYLFTHIVQMRRRLFPWERGPNVLDKHLWVLMVCAFIYLLFVSWYMLNI